MKPWNEGRRRRCCYGCGAVMDVRETPDQTYCKPACSRGKDRQGNNRRESRNLRSLIVELLGGKCAECGVNTNLHIDHVTPLPLGGTNTADNVQLLCKTCHAGKTWSEREHSFTPNTYGW